MTERVPAVTVLMSVYNGEQYLADAMQSVLSQEFADFEFLVFDDGSTDNSQQILRQYADQDHRVRLAVHSSNLGLTRTLNQGIQLARGELIARIDADDVALPGRFSQQVDYLRDQTDCAVVGSAAKLIDISGQSRGETESFSRGEFSAQLFFFNSLTHSSVMFRRQAIADLDGYDDQFTRAQDYDLWLRCLAAGHQIEVLTDALTSHRIHEDRVTATQSERMEQFRRLALRRGWRDVVGAEVSDEHLQLQHRLLLNIPISSPPSANIACAEFRRLRQSFVRRFAGNADAIEKFDGMVKRLARKICRISDQPAEPYQHYVAGGSRVVFTMKTVAGRWHHRLGRARFQIGKWRRGDLV